MTKKKSGAGKFLMGAAIGATIGVLFAPKKGEETRNDLKKKFDEVINNVKNIDTLEVKEKILKTIDELKEELSDLDKEKALSTAKEKAQAIQKKCDELYNLAVEKGTPVLEKSVSELRTATINTLKNITKKLEESEKEEKKTKKVTSK